MLRILLFVVVAAVVDHKIAVNVIISDVGLREGLIRCVWISEGLLYTMYM